MPEPDLATLRRFGTPLFVPSGAWWVAGIEASNGQPNGVLVFGYAGDVEIRTELLTRAAQPLSIRLSNVQHASVNSPDPAVRAGYERVIVDEVEVDVPVCGATRRVRVLCSHNSFSFELVHEGRLIRAAGRLSTLDTLRVDRVDDLALSGE